MENAAASVELEMHVNKAAGVSKLTLIYCNHEQAVVAAADGYTKLGECQRASN